MANYSLEVNSQFRPFSYQELLAPVKASTDAHKDLEEKYSDLDLKSNILGSLLNKDRDIESYKKYNDYSTSIEDKVNKLANTGLQQGDLRDMMSLRSKYSKELVPIISAATKRQEEIKAQAEARSKDNSLEFTRDAAESSVDSYLTNKVDGYKQLSGKTLMSEVAQVASTYANKLRNNPVAMKKIFGNRYIQMIQNPGYATEEIMKVIAGNDAASRDLAGVLDSVLSSSGYGEYSEDQQKRLKEYASRGLYAAVGKPDVKVVEDPTYMSNLNFSHQMALQKNQQAFQREMQSNRTANEEAVASATALGKGEHFKISKSTADAGDTKQAQTLRMSGLNLVKFLVKKGNKGRLTHAGLQKTLIDIGMAHRAADSSIRIADSGTFVRNAMDRARKHRLPVPNKGTLLKQYDMISKALLLTPNTTTDALQLMETYNTRYRSLNGSNIDLIDILGNDVQASSGFITFAHNDKRASYIKGRSSDSSGVTLKDAEDVTLDNYKGATPHLYLNEGQEGIVYTQKDQPSILLQFKEDDKREIRKRQQNLSRLTRLQKREPNKDYSSEIEAASNVLMEEVYNIVEFNRSNKK